MGSFIAWLILTLLLTGLLTVSGYKTKEAWDKWNKLSKGDISSKTTIDPQRDASDKSKTETDKKVVKIKIDRMLDDAQEWLPKQKEHFLGETNRIMYDASSRGMVRSGPHVVLHIRNVNDFIESIDSYLKTMSRNIQDLLLEISENGLEDANGFEAEYQKFTHFNSMTENAIDWAKKQNYATCLKFADKPRLNNIFKSKPYIR